MQQELPASPTTILDILSWAAAHLEYGWAKGHRAVTGTLHVTHPSNTTATAWCLQGALIAAYYEQIDVPERPDLANAIAAWAGMQNHHASPTHPIRLNDKVWTSVQEPLDYLSDLAHRLSSK